MTVLLDSWAWIEFLQDGKKSNEVATYLTGSHDLIISTINIVEIRTFLLRVGKESLLTYITERCTIIPVTEDIAIAAAGLKHRKKLHLANAIILATAQANAATLITGDAHFKKEKDVVYLS